MIYIYIYIYNGIPSILLINYKYLNQYNKYLNITLRLVIRS